MSAKSEAMDRFAKVVAHLDADGMHFAYALACAMNERDTKAELLEVMESYDHDLIMGWLRAHGWLAEGYELGPKSMVHVLRVDDAPGEYLN